MIKRLMEGMGLSTAIVLVTIGGQIMAVPIFLAYWGAQVYGEWLILTNLVSSLTLLNMGIQTYASNLLITHYVRNELAKGTRILHSALRLYTILCSLAFAIALTLAMWPNLIPWLQIKATPITQARLIIITQGILTTYAILGGLLLSLFRVTNQLPRQLRYALIEQTIYLTVPATVAMMGGRPFQAIMAMVSMYTIPVTISLWDVNRCSPYPIGLSQSTWREAFALITPSLVFMAVSVATQLLSTGMTVTISSLAGATAVVIFNTTLMLTNFIRMVISRGLLVLWPEITAIEATNDLSRLARWHHLSFKLASGFALITTASIILLGPAVLTMWTRGRIEVDTTLNFLLALYLAVQAPALVSQIFGLATNKQGQLFKVQLSTAIISLLLASGLLPYFNVSGAAIALIVGQTIGTIWMTYLACNWTNDNWFALISDTLGRGALTILTSIFLLLTIWYILPNLIGHILAIIGLVIIISLLGWHTWLTTTERNLLLFQFNHALNRN